MKISMKKSKVLVGSFLALVLVFVSACGSDDSENLEDDNTNGEEAEENDNSMDEMSEDHLGCSEEELDEDGNCVVAEDGANNVALFEQDFEGEVTSEEVKTEDFRGFVASPAEEGEYPGVVMIHEWWGLNENIEYMAELLASEGYNVVAIDLYDGEVAEDSDKAGELAGSVRSNPEAAVTKMQAAVDYLEGNKTSTGVASLGWCFGGQQSLNLSLADDLDATVIYYGNLVEDPEELASVSGPVLGVFGSEDGSITVESVENFEAALNELGVENDINIYDGVGHAFANPSGNNFAPEETLDAWAKTLEFLESNLK